jgi:hypothetical protein
MSQARELAASLRFPLRVENRQQNTRVKKIEDWREAGASTSIAG